MRPPILGIDLGTTNSCCAVADESGAVRIVRFRGGEFTIPSIFAIDDKGNELVGHEAKRQWQLNPKRTVYGHKRLLGIPYESDLVRQVRPHFAYELAAGERGDVVVPFGKRVMRLTDISGKILAKVKEFASTELNMPVDRAVITVPAYFNDTQRQAVREAGSLAGLEVVRIINEPTAAALAFGANRQANQTVVIYDLGGGTFDISVIAIRDRVFEVKATGGDIFLGGIDFDNTIIASLLAQFKSQHSIDLGGDPVAMQRLRDTAERVKVDLSAQTNVPVHIPFVTMSAQGKPLDISLQFNRGTLESLVTPLVQRTLATCKRVVEAAGIKPEQVEEVLLVGGQTRMPLIEKAISSFFGKKPSKRVHPDEAVATGAALFAWSLDERSNLKLQLLDVLPMAIGIEAAGGKLYKLFARNAPVPNRRLLTFTTHRDNQHDLAMRIYQGDQEMAKANVLLGEFTFNELRKAPAGQVRVEVVFDVNVEGILSLAAKDPETGQAIKHSVRLGSSSATSAAPPAGTAATAAGPPPVPGGPPPVPGGPPPRPPKSTS